VTLLGVGALSTAWAPFAITASRDPAHRQAFTTVFRVVGFGLLVLVCFTVMLTIVVVPLVFPGEYVAAIPAVPFLAGAVAAQGMGGLVSIGLLLTKRTGRLAMIGGVTAVSNVIFNLAAIPRLGIVGAGAATFGSSLVSLGVIYLVAERAYPIGYPAWRFAVASAATGLGVAAALVAYFALPGPAGLALAALVVAAACVLAGFALDVHGVVIGIWRQRGQELPRGRPAEEPVPPAGNGASTATAERSGSTTANAPDPKRVAP
jgi:O-antigen/teichoic acid export membrane protein